MNRITRIPPHSSLWPRLSLHPRRRAGENARWSKVQIKVTKVSGNIYMLEGQGGNIAASVGEDGIVIVDDEFAPLAEKSRPRSRSRHHGQARPLRHQHHYHGDHAGGNAPFATSGSTVIAQDNVRKRLPPGGTAATAAP